MPIRIRFSRTKLHILDEKIIKYFPHLRTEKKMKKKVYALAREIYLISRIYKEKKYNECYLQSGK